VEEGNKGVSEEWGKWGDHGRARVREVWRKGTTLTGGPTCRYEKNCGGREIGYRRTARHAGPVQFRADPVGFQHFF
jgi:hypothetical protein